MDEEACPTLHKHIASLPPKINKSLDALFQCDPLQERKKCLSASLHQRTVIAAYRYRRTSQRISKATLTIIVRAKRISLQCRTSRSPKLASYETYTPPATFQSPWTPLPPYLAPASSFSFLFFSDASSFFFFFSVFSSLFATSLAGDESGSFQRCH